MLCCSCKKNQATNIYETIKDGKRQTNYYCAGCYRRLFISTAESKKTAKKEACPYCKTTSDDFLKTGLVGCEKCYTHLLQTIQPVILRMQGNAKHIGKKIEDRVVR